MSLILFESLGGQVFNMFFLTVASVILSLQNVEGRYDYPRPGLRLEFPNNKRGPGVQDFKRVIFNEIKNSDEKKISYSLPYRDNNSLKQHGHGENAHYQNSFSTVTSHPNVNLNTYRGLNGFKPIIKTNTNIGSSITSSEAHRYFLQNPNKVYGPPKIGQNQNLLHQYQVPIVQYQQNSGTQEFNINTAQQTLQKLVPNFINSNRNVASGLNLQNSLPPKVNFGTQLGEHLRKPPIFFNSQSTSNVLETHDQNIQHVPSFLNLQNDFASQNLYTPNVNINPLSNNQKNTAQPLGSEKTVSPVITKHVYFHAPPPDIEETSVGPTPPKKSYKIIFIKVPSQESKNIKELQAYNSLGSIEDKTLIYLLSNNSNESSQLLVPAYKPSDHEVLFVKYNGDNGIGSDENLTEQDVIYKR